MNILQPKNNSDINGFIHKVKHLKVSCNESSCADGVHCNNAINPSIDIHFCSKSAQNQWMNVSFPKNKILLTHYSYQAPSYDDIGWRGPKSWIFRGLNEMNEWIDLDVVDNEGPDFDHGVLTRSVNQSGLFSAFSLQMYGINYYGNQQLRVYKIDFFGSIDPPIGYIKSCRYKRSQTNCFVFLHAIILSQ